MRALKQTKHTGTHQLTPTPTPLEAVIIYKETLGFSKCSFLGPRVYGERLENRGAKLVIISAYIHHTMAMGLISSPRHWPYASLGGSFCILGMDSNGHSPPCGLVESKLNRLGESMEGVLCEGGM